MSISVRIVCAPEAPNDWVEKAEADSGRRIGIPAGIVENTKSLKRETRELRQGKEGPTIAWWAGFPANEVLRKASACFATIEGTSGIASNAA